MSLDLRIAEISSTAGNDSDGVVRGSVAQSLMVTSLTNVQMSSIVYAYRKDTETGFSQFTDLSTNSVSDVAFEPFGSTANLSANDAFILASDHEVKEIFVRITTPGVLTCDGIEILISTDGITFNTTLTNVIDGTNAFSNAAGVYRIELPGETGHVDSSPVPGEITSRRWHLVKFKNLTSVTTAPQINRVWLIHKDENITYSDNTDSVNASMTDNVFVEQTVFPTIGSTHYYAFPFLAYGMETAVFRKFPVTLTRSTEYLASDGTWKTLPDYVDPSNGLTNGPATLGTTAINYSRRWTIPSDWAEKTLQFPMSDSTTKTVTGYFIRQPITAISEYGPIARALWRARGRAFGVNNANGIYHRVATTYRAATFDVNIPSTSDTNIQLVNINTGKGTTFTIPANTSSSGAVTGQRIDLSPTLELRAGDSLLIAHASGLGNLGDVELRLQNG